MLRDSGFVFQVLASLTTHTVLFIGFVSPNWHFLVKTMNSCVFYIDGNLIENVSSYVHLGHVINAQLDDFDDILWRQNNYIGQVNNVACYFKN